jgi:hypothetical protein
MITLWARIANPRYRLREYRVISELSVLVYKAEDYVYSSAIDYAGQKGLIDDVVVFRMFDV